MSDVALELELRPSPLDAEGRDAIARLYGEADSRFKQSRFLRTLYDENPAGSSWHGFVRDGDVTVGHYSVVPIPIRTSTERLMSAKGEALYLAPAYRRGAHLNQSPSVPVAVALMKRVHDRALVEGAAVIHNITRPEIGLLQRLDGFRRLDHVRRQFHVICTRATHREDETRGRRALIDAVANAHRLIHWIVGVEGELAARDRVVDSVARARPGTGWWVDRDHATMSWYHDLGLLRGVVVGSELAVAAGRVRWQVVAMTRPGLRLLGGLLTAARDHDASSLVVDSFATPELTGLARWGLLAVPATVRTHMFVKPNPESPVGSRLPEYDAFFHL